METTTPVFDATRPVAINLRTPEGVKTIRVRFPTDAEWTERQRRRKVVVKQLGRGISSRNATAPTGRVRGPDDIMEDTFSLGDRTFRSRLIVGTGKYKDFAETRRAIDASGAAKTKTVRVNRNVQPPRPTDYEALEYPEILYKKFRCGFAHEFLPKYGTGIIKDDATNAYPYVIDDDPAYDLILNTARWSVEDCADLVVAALRRLGAVP